MRLPQLLGIELPIIQAPMAGVQNNTLTVAVSNAGGLGSLSCALLSRDALRGELEAIKAQTDKPFNVTSFCIRHLNWTLHAKHIGALRWHPIIKSWGLTQRPLTPDRSVRPSVPKRLMS
jgi:NAD(P)H-dependent flavin oxidoreductase YrpB (nitropropane dioxygenase family)